MPLTADTGHNRARIWKAMGGGSMYAIVFDLDTTVLQTAYHNASWNNAYSDIRRVLETCGFEWQQGSTYSGNERVTLVDCVLAVQELRKEYDWFKPCVRDITSPARG